ncbi:hypothetical protein BaRGS_00000134 [Batillaria attramentaria]|uniref:Uncharacterized protein n=1 Tax=Batillaria attramentaria TaxID=370345 RepID=A0ABD0M9M3_9CAEN
MPTFSHVSDTTKRATEQSEHDSFAQVLPAPPSGMSVPTQHISSQSAKVHKIEDTETETSSKNPVRTVRGVISWRCGGRMFVSVRSIPSTAFSNLIGQTVYHHHQLSVLAICTLAGWEGGSEVERGRGFACHPSCKWKMTRLAARAGEQTGPFP